MVRGSGLAGAGGQAVSLTSDIENNYSELKSIRAPFLAVWREVAERMDPFGAVLHGDSDSKVIPLGDQAKVLSSRPLRARGRFAAAAQSLVTPTGAQWHGLMPVDDGLRDDPAVRDWAQEMTRILFRLRTHPASGWARCNIQLWDSLGTYGTQCFMLAEELGRGADGKDLPPFRYRTIPLSEVCLSVDAHGVYDRAYRRTALSLKNLVKEYGIEALPPRLRGRVDSAPEDRFWVIHAVDTHLKGVETDFPFASVHLLEGEGHILRQGGYWEFPYFPSSFQPVAGSAYGVGPAIAALPDVKMLSVMVQTTKVAAEQTVRPAFATRERLAYRLNLTAGAMNPDLIDRDGRLKIQPINTGANPALGESLIDKTENQIASSFYEDLWQILVNKPDMTAYEAAQRAQEKGDLIGPPFSPQEDMMARCVHRELAILERQAADGLITLPPRPPALDEAGEVVLDWQSPMTRLRRAGELVGINQTLQIAAQIEAFAQGTMARTLNADEILRTVHELSGAPQKALRSRAEVEQAQAMEQEQAAKQAQFAEEQAGLQQANEAAALIQTLQGQS